MSYFLSAAKWLFLLVFFGVLSGCAQPQPIKEIVYVDRDCTRAADYAPAVWLPSKQAHR